MAANSTIPISITTKFASWAYFRGTRLVRSEDVEAEAGEMYQEGSNHGTSCAGVIAAELDAVLSVGAAPGCRLLPTRICYFSLPSELISLYRDSVLPLAEQAGLVPATRDETLESGGARCKP